MEVLVSEIPTRAKRYVDPPDWNRVVARARVDGCEGLARVARAILRANGKLRDIVGMIAAAPFADVEARFVRRLAERMPLGIDESMIAAARGLQLVGLFVCLSEGRSLSECACYRDVRDREVKPVIRRLLNDGLEDWTGLGALEELPITPPV